MVKGKIFLVGKMENTERGIWESLEQREKGVD